MSASLRSWLDGEASDALSASDEALLLEHARGLLGMPHAAAGTVLRGRNLCLLSESREIQAVRWFEEAALGLGCRVAHVNSGLSSATAPRIARETARMLGRLYDAIVCDGVAPDVARFIRAEAGIPVHAVSSAVERADRLAPRLEGGDAHAHRLAVLRAMLESTLSEVRR